MAARSLVVNFQPMRHADAIAARIGMRSSFRYFLH
jgi:hypothetical protein